MSIKAGSDMLDKSLMGCRASRHKTKLLSRNDIGAKNEGENTAIQKALKSLAQCRQKLNGPTILGEIPGTMPECIQVSAARRQLCLGPGYFLGSVFLIEAV